MDCMYTMLTSEWISTCHNVIPVYAIYYLINSDCENIQLRDEYRFPVI
jgi:hypothetical protein